MPSPDYNVDLDLDEPSPELKEYAKERCGEDPNTRLQAIVELRDMIYERGECMPHRMDDEFLIRFLRARRFIPQRAHRLMVNYYKFKMDNPELFENVFPFDLRRIGDANVMAVPPYRDQEGRRLLFYRMGSWDPKDVPIDDILKGTIFALELGTLEPRNQILGGVALFDLEDLSTQHVWQITPSVASKIVKLLVSSFPATTHAIHIINNSWIFDKIYNIFKPFLTNDMRSRIFFHGYNLSSLHEHVHPNHLPKRYGGIWQDYPYTIWLESLKDNLVIAKEMIGCGYKFREHEVGENVAKYIRDNGGKKSSFPATTHAIHIINNSWIFDKIYNIFKPFLTNDMRSRIFFHGYNLSSLHEHVHPNHLPKRYGGIWQDYPYTIWLESLKDNLVIAKEMIGCGYKFLKPGLVLCCIKYEKIIRYGRPEKHP